MRKPGNQEKEFIHGFLDSLFETVGAAREIGAGKIPRPVRTFVFARRREMKTAKTAPQPWSLRARLVET
jgi:hypothetical protein